MRQGKPARRQERERVRERKRMRERERERERERVRERERERERYAKKVYDTFFSRSSYIWVRVFMLASSELAAAEL
jgi:hypothetical protein